MERKQAILWTILLIGGLFLILTLAGCTDIYDMPTCQHSCYQGGNEKSGVFEPTAPAGQTVTITEVD